MPLPPSLHPLISEVHEARPFGSSRAEAQAGRAKVAADPAALDAEYAAARGHGLAKGYHLYTAAPLPVERPPTWSKCRLREAVAGH